MSTFKIEFKTDNAAFMDDPDEDNGRVSGRAIAKVLRKVAALLDDLALGSAGVTCPVRDEYSSGGAIGEWSFTADAKG